MNNWKAATCNANNINIHYTRTGGNKPPVILLHGLMTNGLCWTDLARTLEKDYDVIMPDARGHGQSDVPGEGYQYEDLANDVTLSIIKQYVSFYKASLSIIKEEKLLTPTLILSSSTLKPGAWFRTFVPPRKK